MAEHAAPAVLTWSDDPEVMKVWALQIIDPKYVNILVKHEVTGAGLLGGLITMSKLHMIGMPLGPAAKIMQAVELACVKGMS